VTVPADVAVELQNLHQLYAVLTDEGRGKELADLFTDDVEWDGTELGYGEAHGAQAAAEAVTSHFDPDRPMTHLPGPLLLTAAADDEIHATSWCMATRWADGQARPVTYFRYDDVFRRVGDGSWRIARRVLRGRGRGRTVA
jgi:SnoaL-like domain